MRLSGLWSRVALLPVGALLLSACLDMSVAVKVEEDGSGSLDAALEFDVDRLAALGEMFGVGEPAESLSSTELCAEILEGGDAGELPDGVRMRLVNDADRCAVELSLSWGAGESVPGLDGLSADAPWLLERDGDGWRFSMSSEEVAGSVFGDASADAAAAEGASLDMVRMFAGEMTLTVTVALPGSVVEHNGQLVDDVVRWEMDLFDPSAQSLLVVSASSSGSDAAAVWVFVGAGCVLVAGLVLFGFRRRRVGPSAASS